MIDHPREDVGWLNCSSGERSTRGSPEAAELDRSRGRSSAAAGWDGDGQRGGSTTWGDRLDAIPLPPCRSIDQSKSLPTRYQRRECARRAALDQQAAGVLIQQVYIVIICGTRPFQPPHSHPQFRAHHAIKLLYV